MDEFLKEQMKKNKSVAVDYLKNVALPKWEAEYRRGKKLALLQETLPRCHKEGAYWDDIDRIEKATGEALQNSKCKQGEQWL